jgi:signal peptide peptidase SppA
MKYAHVIQWAQATPWAILPAKLTAILDALAFLAAGGEYSPAEIEAIVGTRPKQPERPTKGGIAVLPLRGTIAHRAGMMTEASGGTSTEAFSAQFREFLSDSEIGAIVLDVDSPGGTVTGVEELAAEIQQARGVKPIVAHVNAMAASAAYWIASAAEEISVTPTGAVGSIGVFTSHQDRSGMYEQMGVKNRLISAGKYKVEANPFGPLDPEAEANLQSEVDHYYGMFTKAVARGRGVPVATVREGYGQGRMVLAQEALAAGMVDYVETMDEMMRRLRKRMTSGSVASVAAKIEEPERAKVEEPRRGAIEIERMRLELARLR